MNRRGFLKTGSATALVIISHRGLTAAADRQNENNEQVLAQARARIPQCRQSEGVILVRDEAGRALPGAGVKVEQVRHDFLFGCNFFMFGRLNEPGVEEGYRERFRQVFNYATLGFYWPYYEPEQGKPIYDYTDRVLDWTKGARITCKGHPLVWDFADPKWLPRGFAEIRELSNARVRNIVRRFKGRLDLWDVVNEPTHLGRFKTRIGEWAISMGAVPYVQEHLQIAREANAQATLLVNDYRTDNDFYAILEKLREDGRLQFDAIGLQSHMHGGGWPLRKVNQVCDMFGRFGVPLHFTETTIVSGPRLGAGENWGATTPQGEEKQAEYVPMFYSVLFGHPAMRAITWWDFSDRGAWQRAAAGWVRKDMSPKPVYERMQALIKGEWWTKLQATSNANGEVTVRAFHGTQRAEVQLANGRRASKEIEWKPGKGNRYEIVVT